MLSPCLAPSMACAVFINERSTISTVAPFWLAAKSNFCAVSVDDSIRLAILSMASAWATIRIVALRSAETANKPPTIPAMLAAMRPAAPFVPTSILRRPAAQPEPSRDVRPLTFMCAVAISLQPPAALLYAGAKVPRCCRR